jgi:putative transposase
LSLLFLARWVPSWKQVLQIIQPDTLLRWHREGFRLFWKLKSRRPVQTQPQRLAAKTIALIEQMARENRLWGAERIRGELLKLNIKVAKRTIQKYMQAVRSKPTSGQSWSTFLKTHGQDIWACDFVPVVTLFFKTLHAFVIVHHESRRVVHVGVTDHPTDEWITQQVRDATPFEDKPKYLICDNDKKYGHMFERVALASGIEVIHTPYEAPRANAICERFVGSLRRECLDHMLVIGGLQLIRILKDYGTYFNQARPHTCTCAPVQVSKDRATDTSANGITARRCELREGDGVPGIERAAPRLRLGGRLGLCWPKKRADERGSQHRS